MLKIHLGLKFEENGAIIALNTSLWENNKLVRLCNGIFQSSKMCGRVQIVVKLSFILENRRRAKPEEK